MLFYLLSILVGMVYILLILSFKFNFFTDILDFLLVKTLNIDFARGVRVRIE